jgi:transposase
VTLYLIQRITNKGFWRDLRAGWTVGEFDRRTEMVKRSLVPKTGGLRVVAIRPAGGGLVIQVEPRESAQCPGCGAMSTARHSAYIRTLRDLPIQGGAVTLRVHAGRWRCRSSSCVRRTFVAQLTALADARQRRTRRLDNVAFFIGHAMGGRPAERLACRLGVPVSRDVILTNLGSVATFGVRSRAICERVQFTSQAAT